MLFDCLTLTWRFIMTDKQIEMRNTRILKMYHEKGMSTRKIATVIGLSKSRVAEITKNYELV